MSTSPTGNLSLTLANLETLIASSASFRAAVDADNVIEAKDSVYWLAADPEATVKTFAWIKTKEGFRAESQGGGNSFWNSIPLQILLQREDNPEDEAKERQVKFLNWLGAVIAEMLALAGTSSYLHVSNLTVSDTVLSDSNDPDHPHQQALLDVQIF